MKLSGYSERYRETDVRSALTAWDRMVDEDKAGTKPLYSHRMLRREERNRNKDKKKSRWFRRLGGQDNDFTLFYLVVH